MKGSKSTALDSSPYPNRGQLSSGPLVACLELPVITLSLPNVEMPKARTAVYSNTKPIYCVCCQDNFPMYETLVWKDNLSFCSSCVKDTNTTQQGLDNDDSSFAEVKGTLDHLAKLPCKRKATSREEFKCRYSKCSSTFSSLLELNHHIKLGHK